MSENQLEYQIEERRSPAIASLYDRSFCGVLNDEQIHHLATTQEMISPFVGEQVKTSEDGEPILSYGLSSYGYDIRLADEFILFEKGGSDQPIDPKNFRTEDHCMVTKAPSIVVPPGALLLARTVEYFKIPRSVLAVCNGKSTLARCGALVYVTPLEPEWEGELVVEITNGTPKPLIIYAHEGIAQLVFHYNPYGCLTSYADRKGKYQGQRGITTARI